MPRPSKILPKRRFFALGPPPIVGLGKRRAGFTLMLQDRAGNSPQYLSQQAQRGSSLLPPKRPEIGRVWARCRTGQTFHKKASRWIRIRSANWRSHWMMSIIRSRPCWGGTFVNNFNLFGRQYKSYVMADAPYRMTPADVYNDSMSWDPEGLARVSIGTITQIVDTRRDLLADIRQSFVNIIPGGGDRRLHLPPDASSRPG